MASGTFPGLVTALWRPAGVRSPAPDCYRLLFNPFATWGSLGMLLLVSHLPPDGAGVPVCLFRAISGLPCPGCGMTRALSSLIQGNPAAALDYHPFSFLVLPLFLLLALHNFLPQAARQRVQAFCAAHERAIRRGYHGFIYAFVGFGVARLLAYASAGWLKL